MEPVIGNILCIISCLMLLTPCFSQQIWLQSSHEQGQNDKYVLSEALPRKLMSTEKATSKAHEGQRTTAPNQHIGISSSGKSKEKGTKQRSKDMEEEIDPSQFLTMDYPRLRRRRPVHNKSLPIRP